MLIFLQYVVQGRATAKTSLQFIGEAEVRYSAVGLLLNGVVVSPVITSCVSVWVLGMYFIPQSKRHAVRTNGDSKWLVGVSGWWLVEGGGERVRFF